MNEFAERVNSCVAFLRNGKNFAGEKVSVLIPVPRGYNPDVSGIELDEIAIEKIEDGIVRNTDGAVVYDANEHNADIWSVTGKVKGRVNGL